MAASEAKAFYGDWSARMTHAKASVPDTVKGFGALFQSAMKEGALSARDKELIALGMGLVLRCDACIYTHAEKCLKLGATREQILEVAGVAVVMQGGPAYTYLPKVVEALDALEGAEAR